MRTWLAILSLLIVTPGWDGRERLPLLGRVARITATPAPLDPADPARARVGRLTYLGGVHLTSPDRVFGGFSALRVEGDRFTLLSDGGGVVRFRLDAGWRLSDPSFAELPDGPGTGWGKSSRDVESIVVDPADGNVLLGLESMNELWRYDRDFTRALGSVAPRAMARWPMNGGAEAMVRLPDGGIVVISETRRPEGKADGRAALRFAADPTRLAVRGYRFAYLPPDGYDPSDAAMLPDGRILLLDRRFDLPFVFAAKLSIVDPRAIRPGATVKGDEIATLAAPLTHDNFEGLAVTREGTDTILWLVSDDNQLFLERTLLMKFRLDR